MYCIRVRDLLVVCYLSCVTRYVSCANIAVQYGVYCVFTYAYPAVYYA